VLRIYLMSRGRKPSRATLARIAARPEAARRRSGSAPDRCRSARRSGRQADQIAVAEDADRRARASLSGGAVGDDRAGQRIVGMLGCVVADALGSARRLFDRHVPSPSPP
jgi:hypothetical protein